MNAGFVEWLAIGLAFVAVVVILRYGRRPRCERCDALGDTRTARLVVPVDAEWPRVATSDGEWTTISWKADHGGSSSPARGDVGSLN